MARGPVAGTHPVGGRSRGFGRSEEFGRSEGFSRSVGSGVLAGIGVAAFVDETVFHQLLHWHHFYDRSTPTAGLVSDGFFHAGGWIAIVAALFCYADLQRRQVLSRSRWVGGILTGWGFFQLYDGLVQHKVLRLHQIRYHVHLLPYDLIWDIAGGVGLLLGILLLVRAARGSRNPAAAPGR